MDPARLSCKIRIESTKHDPGMSLRPAVVKSEEVAAIAGQQYALLIGCEGQDVGIRDR